MKRAILALLVATTTVAPAVAGGVYRTAPYTYHKGHDGHRHTVKHSGERVRSTSHRSHSHRTHNHDHNVGNAVGSLILLPFRVVSSTLHGTAGIVADQDLDGFEEGFNKF